ncbi:gp7.3 [Erwinia phage vB_EamP-L1]|uniref:Gp7.3 n=1 Tax=Erwinia phage vB_EamP-L1 TaxID=1051673 RepID=G0YQ71_9CAUD|nr:host range and adsorption protein [Erwinia phage vB_EamP-L1]AEJ81498.1 gp7.3 [Erwinia phage vB_EamP-L1]
MGLFKKIKKAVKKVTNAPLKAIGKAAGLDNQAPAQAPVAEEAPVAPENEIAKVETEQESGASTEGDRKKARSGGKRQLSVSRNSGAGLNV